LKASRNEEGNREATEEMEGNVGVGPIFKYMEDAAEKHMSEEHEQRAPPAAGDEDFCGDVREGFHRFLVVGMIIIFSLTAIQRKALMNLTGKDQPDSILI
jgi:hypothetical protein